MPSHNIVAVYESREIAERARDRLIGHGIRREDVRLSSDSTISPRHSQTQIESERSNEGFFAWLFGSDIDDADRSAYETGIHGERTAVSVLTDDLHQNDIEDILDQFGPIDLEERPPIDTSANARGDDQRQPPGAMASTMTAGPNPGTMQSVPSTGDRSASVRPTETRSFHSHTNSGHASTSMTSGTRDGAEQVIPVVEEELDVGKRVRERRRRIRMHVTERPAEQDVHLKDERVVVERRPVSGDRAAQSADLNAAEGREFEVIERTEEPVVSKKARAVEEVVVKKEQREHVETVRDTVRRTDVDVDEGNVDRDMVAPDAPANPETIDSSIDNGGIETVRPGGAGRTRR
jgi:uncharacterized protein (TIGR02271 family)